MGFDLMVLAGFWGMVLLPSLVAMKAQGWFREKE